jgi:hypothetical protein
MRLRSYESVIAFRFVFSRKFVAMQLSTFATQSALSGGSRRCSKMAAMEGEADSRLVGLTASDPNAQRQTVSFEKQPYVPEGIF